MAVAGVGLPTGARAEAAAAEGRSLAYARRLPVRIETDVMVCGGGAAGFAAAMAAGGAGDVHAIDVARLQRKLADFGAYLPNRG